jgi:hypothetical protein
MNVPLQDERRPEDLEQKGPLEHRRTENFGGRSVIPDGQRQSRVE